MRRKSIRLKIGMSRPEPWKKQPKGLPRWVKAVPQSRGHGSGHLQKRLWRLTSDFVRIRDFYRYKGKCVASDAVLSDWRLGQAGHFITYTHCNGLFKFDTKNIHFQSAISNKLSTRKNRQQYEATLIERYGIQYINDLEDENRRTPVKFTNQQIVDRMKELVIAMLELKDKPDYLDWVVECMGNEQL